MHIQLQDAFSLRQTGDSMNGILQSIGQKRGQIHIGDRKLLGQLNSIGKRNTLLFHGLLIGGKNQVHNLIFTVAPESRTVRGMDDLADIIQRLLILSIFNRRRDA